MIFYDVDRISIRYVEIKNFIAGMYSKIGGHAQRSNLSRYDYSNTGSNRRNPWYDTRFNLLLRRRCIG